MHSYVSDLADNPDAPIIVDDEWATPDALITTARGEYKRWTEDGRPDQIADEIQGTEPERAAELRRIGQKGRERADKFVRLAERIESMRKT